MEQNIFLTCLAISFIPMKSLKNVAETFKVGFWILPQILFMARDMFFGSSIFFSESIFFILATSICKQPKKFLNIILSSLDRKRYRHDSLPTFDSSLRLNNPKKPSKM